MIQTQSQWHSNSCEPPGVVPPWAAGQGCKWLVQTRYWWCRLFSAQEQSPWPSPHAPWSCPGLTQKALFQNLQQPKWRQGRQTQSVTSGWHRTTDSTRGRRTWRDAVSDPGVLQHHLFHLLIGSKQEAVSLLTQVVRPLQVSDDGQLLFQSLHLWDGRCHYVLMVHWYGRVVEPNHLSHFPGPES